MSDLDCGNCDCGDCGCGDCDCDCDCCKGDCCDCDCCKGDCCDCDCLGCGCFEGCCEDGCCQCCEDGHDAGDHHGHTSTGCCNSFCNACCDWPCMYNVVEFMYELCGWDGDSYQERRRRKQRYRQEQALDNEMDARARRADSDTAVIDHQPRHPNVDNELELAENWENPPAYNPMPEAVTVQPGQRGPDPHPSDIVVDVQPENSAPPPSYEEAVNTDQVS